MEKGVKDEEKAIKKRKQKHQEEAHVPPKGERYAFTTLYEMFPSHNMRFPLWKKDKAWGEKGKGVRIGWRAPHVFI
jgi:hypothetical protein